MYFSNSQLFISSATFAHTYLRKVLCSVCALKAAWSCGCLTGSFMRAATAAANCPQQVRYCFSSSLTGVERCPQVVVQFLPDSLRSAYRRDRIPLLYPWYRVFVLLLGLPQSSWLCGKSGGIGRFNDDVVIGQCASIVEREKTLQNHSCKNLVNLRGILRVTV